MRSELTVNREVNPGPVEVHVIVVVQEEDGTLVPPLVRPPDVADLDGRLTDQPDTSVIGRVHARREAVEEDEYGRFQAVLPPRYDVLNENSARVVDVTLQYSASAYIGVLANRSRVVTTTV